MTFCQFWQYMTTLSTSYRISVLDMNFGPLSAPLKSATALLRILTFEMRALQNWVLKIIWWILSLNLQLFLFSSTPGLSQITIMMHRVYICVTTCAWLSCIYFSEKNLEVNAPLSPKLNISHIPRGICLNTIIVTSQGHVYQRYLLTQSYNFSPQILDLE